MHSASEECKSPRRSYAHMPPFVLSVQSSGILRSSLLSQQSSADTHTTTHTHTPHTYAHTHTHTRTGTLLPFLHGHVSRLRRSPLFQQPRGWCCERCGLGYFPRCACTSALVCVCVCLCVCCVCVRACVRVCVGGGRCMLNCMDKHAANGG